MPARLAFALAVAVAAVAGCKGALVLTCMDDGLCVRAGAQGRCAVSPTSGARFCAFIDGARCGGGLRWDATAGDGLAGTCTAANPFPDGGAHGDMPGGGGDMNLGGWKALKSGVVDWLFAVWGSGPNDVYVGGQIPKAVLHSTDRGATWTPQYFVMPATVNALWGSGPTDIWAVSDAGVLLHSDGKTWGFVTTGVASNLNGLWGWSPTGDAWAVGDAGMVLHFDPSLKMWRQQPTPCMTTLHAAWGTSAKEVFVVGFNGLICHTVDGGVTWSLQNSTTTKNLAAIWGTPNASDVFIASELGLLLHSTDAGVTWRIDTTPVADDLWGVWGSSRGDVYVVGGQPTVLIHYDGLLWSSQVAPTTEQLTSVWGSGAGDVYAVGTNGTIVHGP